MGFFSGHDADIVIGATVETTQAEKSVSGLTDKLGDAMDKGASQAGKASSLMTMGLNALSVAAGNILTKVGETAASVVQQVVDTGLQFNRQMENYQLAFENLLGSAEAANAALEAIKADAASTPFDVAGLVSANRLLISTGQSAEEARQVITALGNAVSASGGGNAELERMAANLQQIANVGKASAIDVRQFAYAGIDIYGLLADYTGMAKDEVQGLTVSYDLLVDALKAASAEGGRYAGAMEAYSQTLQGQMDTLADNATQLAGALTEGLFEAQKELVEAASGWVETLQTTLEAEGPAAMAVAGVQIVFDLLQGVASALPDVAASAVQTVAQFLQGIVQNLPALLASGGQIVGTLIEGILSSLPDLASCAGDLASTIIETIFTTDWLSVGWQVVSGIGSGLLSGLGSVGQSILDWASGVAQGVADTLSFKLTPEEMDTNPYHKGSVKNDDYWKQVGQHFTDTGQDQKGGDYTTAAEKNTRSTYDFSAALHGLSASGSKAAEKVETLADKLDDAHSALTASQQAYKTLSAAVKEYNETGSISLATWQDLMDLAPEYQALLVQEGGKLAINQAAYNELTAAQRLEIETLAQQNGVLPETIQLIDSLGITMEETADEAELAAKRLDDALEKLSDAWSDSALAKLKDLASDLLGGNFGDALENAAELAWKQLDTATQQQLVDMAQGWLDTLETAFAQDGFEGLVKAGKTIAESLAAGLQDTSSATGALIDNVLGQVGISGGVEGLLSVIAELGPVVLGVVATVAAVAAGVAGVAAAFSYTVDQSRELQEQIQALTADGQELSDELSAALDVLQPLMDQVDAMLDQLDQITSMISDTFAGIGIEIMETMIPIIQEILDTLLPVLVDLQPALEAVSDLLRTLLELFGNLVSSVLTALQPVLQAIGPLLETLALLLNSIASIVSALLSPALQALGELLNWLLQPILWVAQAINDAVEWIVSLINPILQFLGLGTIDLPDNSVGEKGQAVDIIKDNNQALEDNTAALEENNELIRNPPSYQIATTGPAGGVADYSAMLAAARAEVLGQQTRVATNYDAGGGTTQARLNASWRGTSTTVLELDGREVAKATKDYMDEELAF